MSDGHLWAADLCFLVGFIFLVVAAVTTVVPVPRTAWLTAAGLAAVALGLFLH